MGLTAFNRLRRERACYAAKKAEEKAPVKPVEPAPAAEAPKAEEPKVEEPKGEATEAPKAHAVGKKSSK